jgi:hypothetical protein
MRNSKPNITRFLATLRTELNHLLIINTSQNNLDIAGKLALTAEFNALNSHVLINPYFNITHPSFE